VREMAENKAECQSEEEWAKEPEDRRTQEESSRTEDEADTLCVSLQR
jgi:hypothetical protein